MSYKKTPFTKPQLYNTKGPYGKIILSRKISSNIETGHYYLILDSRNLEEKFA
jgi:hypothetical protein